MRSEKWISLAERMPEKKGSYLTFVRYRDGSTRQTIKLWEPWNKTFTSEAKQVLYWRDLPEDPEEPKNE